jgi:nitrate reductase gamma subunit
VGNSSFFVIWPYVAVAMLLAGIILRYLVALRQPVVLAAELSEAKTIFGGRVWWISLLTVLGGHLAGLREPSCRGTQTWQGSTCSKVWLSR